MTTKFFLEHTVQIRILLLQHFKQSQAAIFGPENKQNNFRSNLPIIVIIIYFIYSFKIKFGKKILGLK